MDVLNFVTNYWVILVAATTIIGNWYLIRNQMKLFDLRLRHLENNSDKRLKHDADTETKLAVIETILGHMNQNMADMKNDIRRVAEAQSKHA